jgi:phosphoserine phosphatase RsbU/P
MQTASRRMAALIDNVLDFARGRLGGGITLNRSRQNIAPALEQVVQEFRLSHPTRTIEVELALSEAVDADAGRIAQILSNLIANALTHGAANSPIRVAASVKQGQFELSVSNQGEAIPAHLIGELFKPFYRARRMPGQEGLGLGLYIAAETTRAHGGALSATSDANGTVFTLRIPAG